MNWWEWMIIIGGIIVVGWLWYELKHPLHDDEFKNLK